MKEIKFTLPDISDFEILNVVEVMRSGWITTGPKTKLLEKKLAGFVGDYDGVGTPRCVCLNSATAALELSLRLLGIGSQSGGSADDEVITSAYTYTASASVIAHVGAKIVLVDCSEADGTLEMDCEKLEAAITGNTKAIIPVHIQGFPCNMDRIMAIAKKHNLFVLEDACQSDGGTYHGKRLGTIGDAGAYSFNYFKVITAGEGGALITDNRQIFERGLIYHDSSAIAYFGNQLETVESEQFCGTEFRVSEFTGAILREQLKKLDPILTDLHRNRDYLISKLSGKYTFLASNDTDGDCATTLAFWFDSEEEARAFQSKFGGTMPIDTGKHVYSNWTPVMNKRGAFNPAFDPFKMEANKDLNHNYSPDMCARSLGYLRRAVYIGVNPDATEAELDSFAASLLA